MKSTIEIDDRLINVIKQLEYLLPVEETSTCEVDSYGNKRWRNSKSQLHRENGPAIECADGDKQWWLNDKRHRENGPAIEYANGTKQWWLNDKRHRENGPAVERPDGYKAWYLNDKNYETRELYLEALAEFYKVKCR